MPRIQFRRDTAANWSTHNPVLEDGEIGIESDNKRFKLGDGITAWSDLIYSSNRLTDDYFGYIAKEDITNISYGSFGEISQTTLDNGCKINYSYTNNALTLMEYTDVDGVTPVAQKVFTYDGSSQLTSVTKVIL